MASASAPLPGLSLDPTIDLPTAMKLIEANRAAQSQDVQNFGTQGDQDLQGIYSQLQQQLGTSAAAQQQNYDTGAGNIAKIYGIAGDNSAAASAQTQGLLQETANRMGLDPNAVSSARAALGNDATIFALRNQASGNNRIADLQELGSKMGAISQLGIQAAGMAEAQGRKDLQGKIATSMQQIQTAAIQAQSDFTGAKTQQLAKDAATAEANLRSATAQLLSQQNAARSQANSDRQYALDAQRLQDSESQAASKSNDPSSLDTWIAEQQYTASNPKLSAAQQDFQNIYSSAQKSLNPAGRSALDYLLAGMPPADVEKQFKKTTNIDQLLRTYGQLKATGAAG